MSGITFEEFNELFKEGTSIREFISIDRELLKEPEEIELYNAIREAMLSSTLEMRTKRVLGLSSVTSNFLDSLKIKDEDDRIRRNRVTMLRIVHNEMLEIADFSKITIQGTK